MLFGPSEDYSNAFKNLNNSWNFLVHDMGSPMPKWAQIFHTEWVSYRARWKDLEARTFSSASPDWTDVLAGLGAHIAEANSAIRRWKDSGKTTSAALVDDSKLDIEKASSVLQSAASVSYKADEAQKAAVETLHQVGEAVKEPLKKLAPPWWVVAGGVVTGGVLLYAALQALRPPAAVVRVGR